jgi:phospholipid transport system substrate-binding protein
MAGSRLPHQRGWAIAVALLSGLALWAASAASASPATADAEAVVNRLQAGLLRIDREQAGFPDAARAAALAPLVSETHDLDYMARLTLGRQWTRLNEAQQQEFLALFRQVSVMDYARRFRATQQLRFRMTRSAEIAGGRRQVDTVLEAPGEAPVPLQYLLQQTPAGWRIVNILASGVSELALQRSQHQRILVSGGFDALARHLRGRLDSSPAG